MTSSPDPIQELRASRPAAPPELRARIRALAAGEAAPASRPAWLRLPSRRAALVALPAAAALLLASAGILGLARSGPPETVEAGERLRSKAAPELADQPFSQQSLPGGVAGAGGAPAASPVAPDAGRAQRVTATLAVEVADSDAVARAAQRALDLTRALGGHVVSASVATGEEGSASLIVRVPVTKVQEAIVRLSALGKIVSQQITIDDLQERLDALERRQRSLRAQIAALGARLASEPLDPETRARLEARLQNLRAELATLRREAAGTRAEARMATIQLEVVTPGARGVVPVPSRLDRALDEALNVLVWEGVVALAAAIVAAPLALLALVAGLGHRLYRRREEERLLAAR
jgi:ribosomal protein L29